MTTFDLIPHPSSSPGPVRSIRVEIGFEDRGFTLRYRAVGEIDMVDIPRRTRPARTDELWRHTCFEVFIGEAESDVYVELNFSPSTRWAAYRFSGYRQGMSAAMECPPPKIVVARKAAELTLTATVDLSWIGDSLAPARIALAAIIEDRAGGKTYFALAHPGEKPDFHHPESFARDWMKDATP